MSRERERAYFEKLRAMTSCERFALIFELTQQETDRIEQRIRALRPTATDREVDLHGFAILHGRDLAMKAFGWDPDRRGW